MKKVLMIVLGVVCIILGIYALASPLLSAMTIGYIFAATILMSAVANIVMWCSDGKHVDHKGWHIAGAVLCIIFALLIFGDIYFKFAVDRALIILAGAFFMVNGIMKIVLSIKLSKFKGSMWGLVLVLGILFVLLSFMCFANPFIVYLALGINLGINILFMGFDILSFATVIY